MNFEKYVFVSLFATASVILESPVDAFWDLATTTAAPAHTDMEPRTSFFRWQKAEADELNMWFWWWDWVDIWRRRQLCIMAGLSIDFLPIGSGVIINRRTIISAANLLEPYLHRMQDVRIWALGRAGEYNTPYRYRVWRIRRVFPRSRNPEHQHGIRGYHVPRHDISITISKDQIYIYPSYPGKFMYAYKGWLPDKRFVMEELMLVFGTGYESIKHNKENYKIVYHVFSRSEHVVDCSIYLPKWWGKFICFKNHQGLFGAPNGGALKSGNHIFGIGCFEIRYNEDRIMVFTDVRYYIDPIHSHAEIWPGDYYEYASPEWIVKLSWMFDGWGKAAYYPSWQVAHDLFPLGK